MSIKKCVVCGNFIKKPYYIFSIGVRRNYSIGIKHYGICSDCFSSTDCVKQCKVMYLKLAHDETSSALAHMKEAEKFLINSKTDLCK